MYLQPLWCCASHATFSERWSQLEKVLQSNMLFFTITLTILVYWPSKRKHIVVNGDFCFASDCLWMTCLFAKVEQSQPPCRTDGSLCNKDHFYMIHEQSELSWRVDFHCQQIWCDSFVLRSLLPALLVPERLLLFSPTQPRLHPIIYPSFCWNGCLNSFQLWTHRAQTLRARVRMFTPIPPPSLLLHFNSLPNKTISLLPLSLLLGDFSTLGPLQAQGGISERSACCFSGCRDAGKAASPFNV